MNYARPIPRDSGGAQLDGYPAPFISSVGSVNHWSSENAVASSVINLSPNSTGIEIAAQGGQGVVIRWVPLTETAAVAPRASVVSSGLGANFHHHIQPSAIRRFVIPRET